MSDRDPALPTPELLEISARLPRPDAGSPRRRIAWLAAAAVGAAAAGAGLWAWQAWTEQGPQPAEALPGNTLAYVALDLDPPGEQKVEALGALRKFPSLEDQLGLGSVDEVRRSVVEEIASEGNCELNYGDDVEPWIGDRVAFAVVAQVRPEPVVVLQLKDAGQAENGLEAVSRACEGIGFGYAIDGDWAVLARTADVAKRVNEAADGGTLDDDPEYQELTEAAGDPGLATIYAAPEAGPALLAEIENDPFLGWYAVQMFNTAFDPVSTFFTGMGFLAVGGSSSFDEGTAVAVPEPSETVPPELLEAEAELMKEFEHIDELSEKEQKRLLLQQAELYEEMYGSGQVGGPRYGEARPRAPFGQVASVEDDFDEPEVPAALRETLQNFSGLGGVARFEDGGFEVEVVGDILEGTFGGMYAGSAGDDIVSELPDDTAIAYGVGFSEGWVDILITQLSQQFPWSHQTEAETIAALEKATGLDVPGDLEALGGEGLSLVAGSGIDPDQAFEDPTRAPVAVRISGDPTAIEAALEKLRTRMGPEGASMLVSRRVGDDVVVGANAAYLDHLASGGLGDSGRFTQVVPNADDATTVLFVDFDAGDWMARLAESEGDREDAEPLDALGMTVTKDDDQQRMLLRLTFD